MNDGYRFVRRVVSVVGLVMLCLIGWSQPSQAQATGIQPQAEQILRRMSDYLANQQKFTVKTEWTDPLQLDSLREQVRMPDGKGKGSHHGREKKVYSEFQAAGSGGTPQ